MKMLANLLVALVALLTALTSQRAGEVLVLRALGIAATQQSRMRAVESGLVVVLAALLGTAGGVRNVADFLTAPGDDFLVLAGDALTDDRQQLGQEQRERRRPAVDDRVVRHRVAVAVAM